jgi:hypothetical protein
MFVSPVEIHYPFLHFKYFPMHTNIKKLTMCLAVLGIIIFISCQKTIDSGPGNDNNNTGNARLEVRLTDNPNLNLSEVWVDVKEVQIKMSDTGMISLSGTNPGMYDLLSLTNGVDTLLANAVIPAGTISQIRLVLGDNNYAVTLTGDTIDLKTPSAQQSGLKVQVNQTVTGGLLYKLILDFDAAKSVIQAGNSGQYILKPVLRILSFLPSGGNATGIVLPDSVITAIYAIKVPDTIASTFSDPAMGGAYYFNDIPAGNYIFSYEPQDTIHQPDLRNVIITLGQTTIVDTVRLQ